MGGTDQAKFFKTASSVLEMFNDSPKAGNKMLARSGALSEIHGLGGPTAVESDKVDPLKAEAEKYQNKFADRKKSQLKKRPKTYSQALTDLNEVYNKYLEVDIGGGKKQEKK